MDIPERLRHSAVSLEHMRLSEYAWKRDDALSAIHELAEQGYAILGGDVLIKSADGMTHTYDNWYFNRSEEMPWKEFILKSREYAVSYIKRYSEKNKGDYYYVIVFTDEPNPQP